MYYEWLNKYDILISRVFYSTALSVKHVYRNVF